MTISVSDGCSLTYSYGEASVHSVNLPYSYVQNTASTNSCDLSERYGIDETACRWGAMDGHWAYSTQELGNLFPGWHAARVNIRGPTQQVINSWAINLDYAKLQYLEMRRNLFIGTANAAQPDVFYHSSMVDYDQFEKERINLLFNPSFSLVGPARKRVPLGWTFNGTDSTGTCAIVEAPIVVGTHSVAMTADTNESCYLSQEIVTPVAGGIPLTFSIWYMCPMPLETIESDSSQYGIWVHYVYADGTMEVTRAAFDIGTAGIWKKASLTLTPAREVYAINVGCRVINGNAQTIKLYLNAAQLEVGNRSTPWSDGISRIPYITDQQPLTGPVDTFVQTGTTTVEDEIVSGYSYSTSSPTVRRLTYVSNSNDLWYSTVPNKAVMTDVTSAPPSATTSSSFGWFVTPENEFFDTGWRIANNKIEQYNLSVTGEELNAYDIAERHIDDWLTTDIGVMSSTEDTAFERTLELVMVYKSLLWVICTETDSNGSGRYLKVLKPFSIYPLYETYDQGIDMVHLECLGDVELSVGDGTATFFGTVDNSPDQFLIKIDDDWYTIDLQYDYFTIDQDTRQLILRQSYSDGTIFTV